MGFFFFFEGYVGGGRIAEEIAKGIMAIFLNIPTM